MTPSYEEELSPGTDRNSVKGGKCLLVVNRATEIVSVVFVLLILKGTEDQVLPSSTTFPYYSGPSMNHSIPLEP